MNAVSGTDPALTSIHPLQPPPAGKGWGAGNNPQIPRRLLLCLLLPLAQAAFADWPDFRGPTADGHATAGTNLLGLPLRWSETNNVTWKTPIPHRGWSTPVLLGKQIWLTTATPGGNDFFALCVDADSGKILFNERIFHCDTPEPLGNLLNSYASPSPVIETVRVYVHFGSYGTACLDTGSLKVLWKRDDLPCRHFRGPGSSPVLFNDLLILTMDGVDVQYLIALDKQTGKTVWKTDRTAEWNDLGPDGKVQAEGDLRKAYSTPILVPVRGATQLITVGAKAAYGYDALSGREIWKIRHGDFSAAARPLFADGLAYLCTGGSKGGLLAVRVDGTGDVTTTNIVWRNPRGTPRMPSPVLVDGLIFMVSDGGIGSCVEAATGNQLWQERLGGEYAASMLYADGRVYCFNQTGASVVLKPSRTYEVLATNQLHDGFMASPAVLGKALILRTKTHLYRIDAPGTKPVTRKFHRGGE
jgi:outer membrane protein assembly factor BamB